MGSTLKILIIIACLGIETAHVEFSKIESVFDIEVLSEFNQSGCDQPVRGSVHNAYCREEFEDQLNSMLKSGLAKSYCVTRCPERQMRKYVYNQVIKYTVDGEGDVIGRHFNKEIKKVVDLLENKFGNVHQMTASIVPKSFSCSPGKRSVKIQYIIKYC